MILFPQYKELLPFMNNLIKSSNPMAIHSILNEISSVEVSPIHPPFFENVDEKQKEFLINKLAQEKIINKRKNDDEAILGDRLSKKQIVNCNNPWFQLIDSKEETAQEGSAHSKDIQKVKICSGGEEKIYHLPKVLLHVIPFYHSIDSYKEGHEDELMTWNVSEDLGFKEKTIHIFFEFLLKHFTHDRRNCKDLVESLFNDSSILDQFLSLCDYKCLINQELQTFLKKSLIESCLEDKTGNYLMEYFKFAHNPDYPFIQEAWPAIIHHLSQQDLYNQNRDRLILIYQSIFLYIKKNRPTDDSEIEMLLHALFNLFPSSAFTCNARNIKMAQFLNSSPYDLNANTEKISFDNIDAKFITDFCEAWLALRPIGLTFFPGIAALKNVVQWMIKYEKTTLPIQLMNIFLIQPPLELREVLLKALVEDYPHYAALWFFLGMHMKVKIDTGFFPERASNIASLIDYFKKTLELDPNYRSTIIKVLIDKKEPPFDYFDPSIEHEDKIFLALFDKSTIVEPNVLILLAKVNFDKKKFTEALTYLQKSLKINPTDSNSILMYAKCLIANDDFDKSYDLLKNNKKCFSNNPDHLIFYYYLKGCILDTRNDLTKAIKAMNKAALLCMEKKDEDLLILIRNMRGYIHFKLKNFKEALDDLKSISDDNYPSLAQIRDCYVGLKQENEAYAVFETVVDQEFSHLYGNYETCVLLGNEEKADQVLNQILALNFNDDCIDFLNFVCDKSDNKIALFIRDKLKENGHSLNFQSDEE